MQKALYMKIFSLLFIFLFPSLLWAKLFYGSKKNVPIVINSNRLEIDDELKMITFTGNVVARKEDLKVKCNKMVVYYTKNSRIEKIVFIGNVRIYRGQQGGIATSNRAIYYQDQEKLILTENPRVRQGKDFVEGDRIIIYLKQNRSIVESSKNKPVKAVIFPKSKKEKK